MSGQDENRGRGRGRSRGRGIGRGIGRDRAKGRGIKACNSNDHAVAGPSTSTYEEKHEALKKSILHTKKTLQKMDPSVKEELMARKRLKEISRSLLPDAPQRERARKLSSPERTGCILLSGTPTVPPAPQLQPWQIRMETPTPRQMTEIRDDCSTPVSIITSCDSSSVMDLQVDWTTGLLKNPEGNTCLLLEDSASNKIKMPDVPVSNNNRSLVKLINEAVKGKDSTDLDENLARWLEEQSDEEEAEDKDLRIECDSKLTPAHILDECDAETRAFISAEDRSSDQLMAQLLPKDHLNFEWSCDRETFTGTRETFTGQAGPTFDITEETTPVDVFLKFFDDELLQLLTTQTNRYASFLIDKRLTEHSRLNYFKNIDREEMYIFLAILIFQGLAPIPMEKNYWEENGYLTFKYFKNIMTFNRFILLKRLLHFTDSFDSSTRLTQDEIKLRKIQPLLDLLKHRFSTLYLPGQDIAIDESLLKWQGRLSFAQRICSKAAKVGIKSYELCESATGYLWNFFVYSGKQAYDTDETEKADDNTDQRPGTSPPIPANATAKIVHSLAMPLFNRGHTIIMDNFYNSPLLARYLKSQGTDCFGTLRVNREFVPETVKSVSKSELRQGEMVQSFCRDLHVMMWRDANVVSMLSTYHKGIVGGKSKYGVFKYKPEIVLDYNIAMGGVDKKDQLLAAFPMERSRNQIWYKKVFRRLLNVTLVNCYIIYKTKHNNVTSRWFRTEVAEKLIKIMKHPEIELPIKVTADKYIIGPKSKKIRPILEGNHFVGVGASKYLSCVWCKKSRTKYICKQCEVSLCLEICFENYHTVPCQG